VVGAIARVVDRGAVAEVPAVVGDRPAGITGARCTRVEADGGVRGGDAPRGGERGGRRVVDGHGLRGGVASRRAGDGQRDGVGAPPREAVTGACRRARVHDGGSVAEVPLIIGDRGTASAGRPAGVEGHPSPRERRARRVRERRGRGRVRRRRGGERVVVSVGRPEAVLRHEPVVVGGCRREPREVAGDGDRRAPRPEVGGRGLAPVRAGRPVLDPPRRVQAVLVDAAGDRRATAADALRVRVLRARADRGAADPRRPGGGRARDRPDPGGAVVAHTGVADVADPGSAAPGRAGDDVVELSAVGVGPLRRGGRGTGDRVVGGNQRRREAGPADHTPGAVVVDVQSGRRIAVRREVRVSAAGASGVGLVARLWEVHVAAGAPAGPRPLAEAARTGAGGGGERGPAGSGHAGERGRVIVLAWTDVSLITGCGHGGDSRERVATGRDPARGERPAGRDLVSAHGRCGLHPRVQVTVVRGRSLDEQDVAVGADGGDRVEVDRDLAVPRGVGTGQR
jgi:hypothetical protein